MDVEVQERAFTSHELLRGLNLMPSALDGPTSVVPMEMDDDSGEEDILLGMANSSNTSKKARKKATPGSLGGRCRTSSAMLNYLFKPEAMKPISAKAQRKKRQTPIGLSREVVDDPVDMSVFEKMMEATQKPSMEQVTFTQQRLMPTVSPVEARLPMDISGFGGSGANELHNLPNPPTSKLSKERSYRDLWRDNRL